MQREYSTSVAERLQISSSGVKEVLRLFAGGATVPFIARYRKEVTGSLDEVQILAIRTLTDRLKEVDARRASIISALEKNNQLSAQLLSRLTKSDSLAELEDLYLPYRPKRKTRAAIARERGLLPLAEQLFRQTNAPLLIETYLGEENEVRTPADALAGARDIIAEMISEDAEARTKLRALFKSQGIVRSTVVTKNRDKALKFRDYFDHQEPVPRLAGHRFLAMCRGEITQPAETVAQTGRSHFTERSVPPLPEELPLEGAG